VLRQWSRTATDDSDDDDYNDNDDTYSDSDNDYNDINGDKDDKDNHDDDTVITKTSRRKENESCTTLLIK